MNLSLESTISFANTVDRCFDVAGYIPGVSALSGPLRATIGKVMVVVGFLFWVGFSFIERCEKILDTHMLSDRIPFSYNYMRKVGKNLMKNGAANYVRGLVESLGLLGNALVLGYDYFIHKRVTYKLVDYNDPNPCQTLPVFNQEHIDHAVTFIRKTVHTLRRNSTPNSGASLPNVDPPAVGVGAAASRGALVEPK